VKAMILAAGLGERMRPLSLLRAKPALPVLGRPLIQWTLETLAGAGVTDVVVNLHHLPESVRAAVGKRPHGLRVIFSHERRILGTAGALRRARRFLGDDPILLVNGDVVFDFELADLVRRHRRSAAQATLALRPNPDPDRYGPVVTSPDGRVLSLAGCPRRARGRVSLFTGVQVLDPSLIEMLPPGRSDIVPHLYAPAIERGDLILGVRVRGAWYDLGHPAAYRDSQLAMMVSGSGRERCSSFVDPRAKVGDGVRLDRSVVWDGVRIGRGARITRSVVAANVGAGEVVRDEVVVPGGRERIA
jgi:mannose-1-phosphate guanylyltransferase